jgi:MFS family permease
MDLLGRRLFLDRHHDLHLDRSDLHPERAPGVPESTQGAISGNLVFLTEIVTLLLFLPAGVLMDRIGRRGVYAAGFLVLALTYVLYPLAESVESLYLYRILYAIGVVAVAGGLSTVLADYPAERSRGKLVAIVGVLSGLGVVLISQGFGALPKVFAGRASTVSPRAG